MRNMIRTKSFGFQTLDLGDMVIAVAVSVGRDRIIPVAV